MSWIKNVLGALASLADVDLTGVQDGDVLTYDSGTTTWGPEAPSGGVGDYLELDMVTDPGESAGKVRLFAENNGEGTPGLGLACGGGSTAYLFAAGTGTIDVGQTPGTNDGAVRCGSVSTIDATLGRVITDVVDLPQIAAPAALAGHARLFARLNGGATELCVIFPGGDIEVIKVDPNP